VPRTRTLTLLFAVSAALVTALTAVLAYQGLRLAFVREFDARLAKVATIAATQVSPEDEAEIRKLGAESGGYFALQAQLDMLRAVTGFENLALVDRTRATLYDVELGEQGLLEPSPYDSLAHGALAAALAGRPTSASFRRGASEFRAAFAPVREGRIVTGVLVVEAHPSWAPELQQLRRRLALIGLVSVAAIAVLTVFLLRSTTREMSLERRLTRSENLAAMGRLTATLAHEIKNPLAIIRGSARRLGKLEPEAQRLADSVIEEVDRLVRTVGRYLQFARGDGGSSETGDLVAATVATLDLLEGEFQARHCALVRSGLEGMAAVRLDPETLKQVGLNLVLNALEVLPEGGTVHVGLSRRGARVELSVRDDGPGIPADVLPRLGQPFFTTKAKGTGLGLFLVRRLVEGAGGSLALASPPEGGATVTITLPVVESRPRVGDNSRGTPSRGT